MNETPGVMPAAEELGRSDAIEELPVAYVEMDARGAVTRANRLTRALHSSHVGELIGILAWEAMPTEEQERSCAAFAAAMEKGVDPPVVRRSIYSSCDAFRIYDLHRNLIRDSEGQPVGMRVVSVDVTEAHLALQKAERASQWLESVFASMADAVIITDALGFIRNVNPAAEELFGWKAEQLLGKEAEKALSMLYFIAGNKSQHDVTKGLDHSARGVATMLTRERQELWVEIRTSPIVDKVTGVTAGVVSVMRRMEEALSGAPILMTAAHNDFTAWNIRVDGGVARVFDWEYACEEQLPLFDPLHFVLMPMALKREPTAKMMQKLHETLAICESWFGREECLAAETQALAYLTNLCTLYLWSQCGRSAGDPVLDSYARVIDCICSA